MSQTSGKKKKTRSNEQLCLTIAKSISDVIRFSLNDNFRREAFDVLHVQSTNDAELEIYRLFMKTKCVADGTVNSNDSHESVTHPEASSSGTVTTRKRVMENAGESILRKRNCHMDMSVKGRQVLRRTNSLSILRDDQVNNSDFFPNHSEMWDMTLSCDSDEPNLNRDVSQSASNVL